MIQYTVRKFLICLNHFNDDEINAILSKNNVLRYIFNHFLEFKDVFLFLAPKFSEKNIVEEFLNLNDMIEGLGIYYFLTRHNILKCKSATNITNNYMDALKVFLISETRHYNIIQNSSVSFLRGGKIYKKIFRMIFDEKPLFIVNGDLGNILSVFNIRINKTIRVNQLCKNFDDVIMRDLKKNIVLFIQSIEHMDTNISNVFNNLGRVILTFLY